MTNIINLPLILVSLNPFAEGELEKLYYYLLGIGTQVEALGTSEDKQVIDTEFKTGRSRFGASEVSLGRASPHKNALKGVTWLNMLNGFLRSRAKKC